MNTGAFDNWYPIAFSQQIQANQLYPITLLNEPLILYRDANQRAACLQDRCPHRSTPLSLGRLVNGTVECRYHGWQFDQQGQCKKIPAQHATDRMPPRACVPAKACIEQHGIIWVSMNSADPHQLPACQTALFAYENDKTVCFDFTIDLDLPHELMIENLLDPSHLPFAHHGTISKREKAYPINFEVTELDTGLQGTATVFESDKQKTMQFEFVAPHTVYFDTDFGNKGMRQLHYCIPLSQNKMRLNSRFFYKNMPWLKWIPFANALHTRMSKKIVHQDLAMLAGQNTRLHQGAKAWNQAINADKLAMRYRQWLNQALAQQSPWFEQF